MLEAQLCALRRRRISRLPAIALFVSIFLSACQGDQQTATPAQPVAPPAARKVEPGKANGIVSSKTVIRAAALAPGQKRRIVSLAPSVTETLFALGLGPKVKAVTRFCDYPERARDLDKIGGFTDPNVEAILAHQPDLVVGVTSAGGMKLAQRFDNLDVPFLFLRMESFDETFRGIEVIGSFTGTDKRAAELVAGMRSDRAKLEQSRGADTPSVLWVYGHKPIVAAGPGSFADEMIALAGGKNVLAGGEAYPVLDAEKVLALDPEIIIDAVMGPRPATAFWSAYPQLRAVERRRVHELRDEQLMRPGPRLLAGATRAAEAIRAAP